MGGACAIVLDKDKTYVSFARTRGGRIFFVKEQIMPFACNDDIAGCLRKESQALEKIIREVEQCYKFRVEKIFVQLPNQLLNRKNVSDIIPLKRRKKINTSDVSFAKKYLEDKFLDWNDSRVHNIVLSYEAANRKFSQAPIGVWSHRIELCSFLVWVKDKLCREMEDVFDSIDRNFAGFVASYVGIFSSAFSQRKCNQIVLSIEYDKVSCVVSCEDGFTFREYTDFGLKTIIDELARHFLLDVSLARELFERYISFKEIPYYQEVTVKKDGAYVNVSTQSLNSFVKQYVKSKIAGIIEDIKTFTSNEEVIISIIGRLGAKEGVFSFFKECVPYSLRIPLQSPVLSSSYGCLFYGVRPFMERGSGSNESFLKRVMKTYREYF
jgi:cell division ATPase FtsA